jgi:hypothetical protein
MSVIGFRKRPNTWCQWIVSVVLLGMALTSVPNATAQVESTARVEVSGSDVAAAASFSNFRYHILPANTPAGKIAVASHGFGTAPAAKVPSVPSPGFYPDDLTFFGGPVAKSLVNHNVYVDCALPNGGCWGNPSRFLSDLNHSKFIHVTDQYVGTRANGRYPVGKAIAASFDLFTNTIGESDLLSIVHAAAKKEGTGHGHIYHVFLPNGVDTCFDRTTVCYSPDDPRSFFFCAYHASVTFNDIGHVLYSVEPYQNVPGCQVAPPHPNGILADSTNSTLSHELIEAITDPDPGSGWVADSSLVALGAEIGDICEPVVNDQSQFLDPVVPLNARKYELQLEYSNKYHACAGVP